MRGLSYSSAVVLLLVGISSAFDFGYPYVERLEVEERIKRDTAVKHKTQHLKPAIEIEPLPNQKVKVAMPHINGRDLVALATQAATTIGSRFDQVEPALFRSNGAKLVPGTPAWYMAASHKTKIMAKNISRIALVAEETSKLMSQSMKLTKDQITFGLPVMDVRGTILAEQCPLEVDFPCQPRKYRAFNGYCNNVQNPRWGNANTRYLRFLPPDYSDGVSIPRQALSGAFLPSARDVSLAVHKDTDNPHDHLTALTAIWGELVLHDISHTPQMAGYLGQRLRCCGVSLNDFHPECYPIRVPDTDPVYSKQSIKCQEYVRSGTAPRVGCTLGPREQINQVTSYLDASAVYGSSAEEANELRLFQGGLLKTQVGNSTKGLLPADDNIVDCRSKNGAKCFKAGDVRSNEHVELSAIHVLLMREHNRLATELAKVNPHWSDETLFQEARRIVGAELQHITYSEFLPVVLGQSITSKYGLEPEQTGYFTGYDININPGIANGVAAAALRFVTSLMPKTMQLYQKGRKVSEENMGSSFYAPFALYNTNALDMVLEGMVRTKAQAEDQFINDIMTSHMFEDKADGAQGLDLAAQIIQQGRDHGVPGYVKWREFCSLPKVQNFEQLSDVMTTQTIATLKSVYRNVEDIDLFTGGIAEISSNGALVGPTFGCLIGRQFHYLRRGDRYWYENELPPSSFTKDQLHAIRKTSLARLICDNSDGMPIIQPKVFLISDPFLNADMSCTDGVIPRMDLGAWKTASPHFVIPDTLLQESVTRAKREADDYLLQEQALLQDVLAPTPTLATYYDAITNLSVWNNSTSSLVLTRLITPPPSFAVPRRQFDLHTVRNPALRAWLAPIFFKFPPSTSYSGHEEEQYWPAQRRQDIHMALNPNNVAGHLNSLLATMQLTPAWETANQRQANDYLYESVAVARRVADMLEDHEVDLWSQTKGADPKSAVGTAFSFSRPKRQATLIANVSRVLQFASKRFVNSFLNTANQKDSESRPLQPSTVQDLVQVLPNIDVSDVVDIPKVFQCDEQTLPCDHTSKFRTMTGWCNNLNFPEFGKSMRAFIRLLPPRYDDGISAMRSRSLSGRTLPSARMVSANIHNDVSAPHVRYSLMVMQFGQLLDHDLTFTPVNRGFGGSILDCTNCESARTVHPECSPIPVPNNDPWYPAIDRATGRPKCIAFTRSLPGQLTLGYREQLNQVTAFVDASHTYGSDVCESRMLRSFIGGRLNATRHPIRGKDLLPQTSEHLECKSPSNICFEGGDTRASEQPGLASIHTIFMREHNRIVDELARINPHWTDEQLFQNGRRIMSAEFQHITYNEFLPRVLGWNAVQLYELKVLPEGYYNGYDPTCNPSVFNEFAAAAFRFGHSLLKDQLKRLGSNYEDKNLAVKLRDGFMNPDVLYEPGMIDEILRGLLGTSMENLDQFITHEVTNHLFEEKHIPFSGLDLASLNIQRARDHGIPPYNEYRALCNLKRAKSFEDLSREITPDIINRLRQTYETVDDIDLFPGGLSETPLHGGLVGPTFACIIAMQFRQLRKCDRFWYENGDPLIRFTEAQLTEIRKGSIAKVICDNSDSIDTVQRSGFDQNEPFLNPRVPCKSLPSIDLELWKERVSCTVGSLSIEVGKAERISPCVMCTCTKEGPVCQSLKIINCFQLAQTFSPAAILNDHVCKVQCAFAFRAFPQVAAAATDPNQLGFS